MAEHPQENGSLSLQSFMPVLLILSILMSYMSGVRHEKAVKKQQEQIDEQRMMIDAIRERQQEQRK